MLCLWAGADPRAPAPNPALGISEDADPEDGEERFIGWSAIEEAASHGHLPILKRLGPDAARDDFDSLYQWTRSDSIVRSSPRCGGPGSHADTRISVLVLGDRFPSAGTEAREPLRPSSAAACGGRKPISENSPASGGHS